MELLSAIKVCGLSSRKNLTNPPWFNLMNQAAGTESCCLTIHLGLGRSRPKLSTVATLKLGMIRENSLKKSTRQDLVSCSISMSLVHMVYYR